MAGVALVTPRRYTLLGADRRPYRSAVPGQFGGHRQARIYRAGSTARRPGARSPAGAMLAHRVFFADEPTAVITPVTGPARSACPLPTQPGNRAGPARRRVSAGRAGAVSR